MTISFDDSLKPGWLNFDPGDGEVRGLKAHVGEYSHVAFSLVLVVPEASSSIGAVSPKRIWLRARRLGQLTGWR